MTVPSSSKEQYGIASVTLDGINVNSRAEKSIGDFLFLRGVKYVYEKVLLDSNVGKPIAKPDFYLPDYDVYIEYWGRLDDEKYSYDMRRKKRIYKELNCKLISLYEKRLPHLDWILRKEVKALSGKDFPPLPKDHPESA